MSELPSIDIYEKLDFGFSLKDALDRLNNEWTEIISSKWDYFSFHIWDRVFSYHKPDDGIQYFKFGTWRSIKFDIWLDWLYLKIWPKGLAYHLSEEQQTSLWDAIMELSNETWESSEATNDCLTEMDSLINETIKELRPVLGDTYKMDFPPEFKAREVEWNLVMFYNWRQLPIESLAKGFDFLDNKLLFVPWKWTYFVIEKDHETYLINTLTYERFMP